jgi:Plant mobile domain
VEQPVKGFADTKDVLGIGLPDAMYIDPPPMHERKSVNSHGYSRETQLTAFLAWWLGYFVLPSQRIGKIRPSTFIMANLMARGKRISLAILALANIYQTLRIFCTFIDPTYCSTVFPWHFIYGWLNIYWSGVCSPALPKALRKGLPLMADIASANPKDFKTVDARLYFDGINGHLKDHSDRSTQRAFTFKEDREVDRILLDADHDLTDAKRYRNFEFLVSIHYGFLPLRIEDIVILEPYLPHRCAHQFGFDQDLPLSISRPVHLSATLENAGKCWLSILRILNVTSSSLLYLGCRASLHSIRDGTMA